MINKTVTFVLALLLVASFALVGCGSGESTEDGIEDVKTSGQGQQPIEAGTPSDGSSEPNTGLKMPPGKSGGN